MSMTVRAEETLEVRSLVITPAQDRAVRSMSGIAALFAERPELRGVHAPADLADDAIRWSA